MRLSPSLLLLGLAVACASHGGPDSAPAPTDLGILAQPPAPPSTVVPETVSVVLTDSAATSVAGPDSVAADPEDAADAAVLEQLAAAHPSGSDSGEGTADDGATTGGANEVGTPASWDIDVTTYGTHARVQFYLDFFQTTARDRFTIWLQRMPRYEPMIRQKLRDYGLPEDMVYLALIESGFSNGAVSRSRAVGMWQFMKGTGRLYGLKVDSWVDERRDPVKASDAAARHLSDLRAQFGSLYLAAAAYNAGAGRVNRGLRRLGLDDEDEDEVTANANFFRLYDTRYLRRETKDYVPKLIAAALIAKEPEKYGFPPEADVDPLPADSLVVRDATGLDVVARLADTSAQYLRELNPQYLRAVTPPGRTSVIRLPAGSGTVVAQRYEALGTDERVSRVEHVVSRGQSVASIARLYGVSSRIILDANPSIRARRLRAGTRLVIPTSYAQLSTADRRSIAEERATAASNRHRVRYGESLSVIARRYRVTVTQLRTWNAIGDDDLIKAGQLLWVKAPGSGSAAPRSTPAQVAAASGQAHLVRRGETLSGIAGRYGVTVSALRAANDMSRGDVLRAGVWLRIP